MIPDELLVYKQWVRVGNGKIPLNPINGEVANVNDPETWATYTEALSSPYGDGIGFVFTFNDPYTFIDLDAPLTPEQTERHRKVVQAFDSYTELSRSGQGVHIIIRGAIPAGKRRDKVEVYSAQRYAIMTGQVIGAPKPIAERQELLTALFNEMGETEAPVYTDEAQSLEDSQVIDMAARAENGEKFQALWQGHFEGYPSQSEADFALLSIIAFYSKNNDQVMRLFRSSALGQRKKADRDSYLLDAIGKIRAKTPPEVDFSSLDLTAPAAPVEESFELSDIEPPPGLVGDIARYIYCSSTRPVPEVSLAAALGLVAGIAGRSYNVSGTGLNQYIALLAQTGTGKESLQAGIDSLITCIRPQVPSANQFVGPGSFASGQALIRILDENPCFVSIMGELGLTLQTITAKHANHGSNMLKKVLLDLYNKSGVNRVLHSSAYADSEKNTKAIRAPNVTILGESTPEAFYDALDMDSISHGLIPRFCIVEYNGPRPPRNRNANQAPSQDLIQRLADLAGVAMYTSNNGTCCDVRMDVVATSLLDAFDVKCDAKINSGQEDATRQVWNRAHLKALKLAALLAVGVNLHDPVITEVEAKWALAFVERDCGSILRRFQKNEVGLGEHRFEGAVRRAVRDYQQMDATQRASYRVPKGMLEYDAIPYTFFRRRLQRLSEFATDRKGATRAVQDCLSDMVRAEILIEVPAEQAYQKFSTRGAVYVVGPSW